MKNALFKFLIRHWVSIFTICFTFVMLVSAISISLNAVNRTADKIIIPLSRWIKQYKTLFFIYHFLIIFAVYWLWGLKVDRIAFMHRLSAESTKKLKSFRWFIIVAILCIDLIAFIGDTHETILTSSQRNRTDVNYLNGRIQSSIGG